MIKRLLRLFLALTAALAGMCSLSPLGGGTETGNPDGVLACARAVFEEVDEPGRWSPSGYLPGGEGQLDPNGLLTQKPRVSLGKSAATTPTDTLVIVRDSNFMIITIAGYDTVRVIDTVYNNAVVVRNRSVYDTVYPIALAAESGMVISERIVPDTVWTIDTMVRYDTLMVPIRDTVYFPLTDSLTVYKVYSQPDVIRSIRVDSIYIIVASPKTGTPSSQDQNTSFSLSRTSLVQGTTVAEKYRDADGDGYLFGPDLSQLPTMNFNNTPHPVLPGRVRFTGSYAGGDGRLTVLSMLFDAGADRTVTASSDNRILSLYRQKTMDSRITERITYVNRAVDSAATEPCLLVAERYPEAGAVLGETAWFHFLHGPDSLDHRQNRLSAFEKERYYRGGALWLVKTKVRLREPETAPARSLYGQVSAEMFFNNQEPGSFSGVVDKAARRLYGEYQEGGVRYRVTYHRDIDWIDLQEIPATEK